MGNLALNKALAWNPDDYQVSEILQGYFSNFVKTGDPNGPGLPHWPVANSGGTVQVMHIDVKTRVEPEHARDRYLFLDHDYLKK
jgi:para-nitrobenzyl esterase